MVKIVRDELALLMGGQSVGLELQQKPSVVLMAGLQGSGKTTFSGKLANYLKTKKAKKPLLVACDVYRPAAIEQLSILAAQIGVDVYANTEEKNPLIITKEGLGQAKTNGNDVVIIDTAGRLAVDQELMDEIKAIHDEARPDETLFVVDSMTGQDAVNTAEGISRFIEF